MQVQTGFGRAGSAFWAFETQVSLTACPATQAPARGQATKQLTRYHMRQGVVPDMVTLGKPIGNGFPMGAVMLTRQLAEGFDNGMQYFATCGACTAACAAGEPLSVLFQGHSCLAWPSVSPSARRQCRDV